MKPTLFEIAVVLSSAVFLIAPMFVAQAAGAGDDFVLGIYGNANEDDTIVHDLCVLAGGKNIAEGYVEGYADVETEWILDQNPDVIVGISYKGGYETDDETKMREHYEEIRALPGFKEHVTAVQNDSVFIMSNAFAFAPHYPAPLAVMAKWLYPKRFADFKPEAIHQEYIDEFLGIDFDVYEQGVFVFPRR